jgi:hypothetical protein
MMIGGQSVGKNICARTLGMFGEGILGEYLVLRVLRNTH